MQRLKINFHKIKTKIDASPRKFYVTSISFLVAVSVAVVMGSLYQKHVETTAMTYNNNVTAYVKKVLETNVDDPVKFSEENRSIPKFEAVLGGDIISGKYRDAKKSDAMLREYGQIIRNMKDQAAQGTETYKKLESIALSYRKSRSDIISKQKNKETALSSTKDAALRGLPEFNRLKDLRADTLRQLQKDSEKHAAEVKAVDVLPAFADAKRYHLSVLEKERNLLDKLKADVTNVTTYPAIDRIDVRYLVEAQPIENEVVASLYSFYSLSTYPRGMKFAIKASLQNDLRSSRNDSDTDAAVRAMTKFYARYTMTVYSTGIQPDNFPAGRGAAAYGIYMMYASLSQSDNSDSVKKELKGKVDEARSSVEISYDWTQSSAGKAPPVSSQIDSITDNVIYISKATGYATLSVYYENVKNIPEMKFEPDKGKQLAYEIIDKAPTNSDVLKNEISALRSDARECVDKKVAYQSLQLKNRAAIDKNPAFQTDDETVDKVYDESATCFAKVVDACQALVDKGKASTLRFGQDAAKSLSTVYKE